MKFEIRSNEFIVTFNVRDFRGVDTGVRETGVRPVVRTHAADLHAARTDGLSVLESLNSIDWSSLTHAHGPATDVPDLLRALVSEDPDERLEAVADAHEKIWHQGTIFPASAAVVPFLCELLNDPDVLHKAGVVSLLGCIATGEGILAYSLRFNGEEKCRRWLADDGKSLEDALAQEAAMMRAIHDGVSPVVRDLLPWLQDTEGLGSLVAEVLGEFPEHTAWLVPAIDAALTVVSDEYTREKLVESRGRLMAD